MTVELFDMVASPPCRSVKVLANRIGLDLKITSINMMEGKHLEPEYLKMNPFHTIPTINDDGFYLFESRAIMLYLVNKYASDSDLYPKDLQKRALVDAMLNFDIGTLALIYNIRIRSIIYTGKDVSEIVLQKGKDNLKCLDNVLSTRKYAAGDHLTLADIAIVHTLSMACGLEDDVSEYTHVAEYRNRVSQDLGVFYNETTEVAVEQFKAFVKSKKTSETA